MPRGQSDVEGEAAHEVLRLGEVVEEADDLESALVQEALAVVAEFTHFQLCSFCPLVTRLSIHTLTQRNCVQIPLYGSAVLSSKN